MNTNNSTISSKTYVPFKTAGVERARIDQSGNIGINTTAPSAVLDINGNTKMRGQLDISGNNIINIGSLGIGTATPAFALDISGNMVCRGNVGIGITPTTVLDVNGAAKIRGTLDLTSQKITNVASPTTTTDVATKSYVDIAMPIGGIIMWSGATPPTNWGLCDGSTYGSVVSPDLRGRFVLSSGQGSGLTNRTLGQTGGAETITLSNSQIPNHTHSLSSSNAPITSVSTINNSNLQTFGQDVVTNNRYALFYSNPNTTWGSWFSVSTTSTISGRTDNISNYTTQSSVPIMSPFYILAFIIRYQ